MKMKKYCDPVAGKVLPVFLGYALPSIFGMLAVSGAVVVDGYFVGNYAGVDALASVNLTAPASGLMFGIALMLSVGGAARCGKYLGAGDHRSANRCFSQTVTFLALVSLLLSLLGILFMDKLVLLLGANQVLAKIVGEYFSILLLFAFFQLGVVGLSAFVRVDGFPVWAAISAFIGCLCNVLLDWLLIVKLHMGHKGAALGTGLAEVAAFALLCVPFVLGQTKLRFQWKRRGMSEVLKAAYNGLPELSNEFSVGIVGFLFNWLIMQKLGENGIAAFSVINYMILSGLMISYGIGDSLQPVLSKNYGALKARRIKKFLVIATASVFVVGVAISGLLLTMPETLIGLFLRSVDPQTMGQTLHFISRIWPIFILNGVNIVLVSYLTAMHRSLDSTLVVLARNLLLPVFFLLVIRMLADREGILVVLPLSELAAFFLAAYMLHKNRPRALVHNRA